MNERPSVVIRVDGSAAIGLGHIARMATLADACRAASLDVAFAVHASSEPAVRVLSQRGWSSHIVSEPLAGAGDADTTVALAARQDAGVVIVDGYHFGRSYLEAIHSHGFLVCSVDDLGGELSGCDIVLNANVYASAELYAPSAPPTLLLGPSYALLANGFRVARSGLREGPVRAVLVTMGGSDPTGETRKVIDALALVAPPALDVCVVLGSATSEALQASLQEHARRCPHSVRVVRAVTDMPERMASADLAITAAGTTCLELACVGVPSIVIAVADNQRAVAAGAQERGLMRSLGWHDGVTAGRIATAVDELRADPRGRRSMVEAQHALVDGRGSERVVEALLAAYGRRASEQ